MKLHNFVKNGKAVLVDLDEVVALDMAGQRIVLKGGAVIEAEIRQYEYELFKRRCERKGAEE